MSVYRNFVGGEWIESRSGDEIPNLNPANTAEVIGMQRLSTREEARAAVPIWKIAPALVAGNAVILKPAEQTPECAKLVAQIFEQSGLPAGVLNVIFGRGEVVGDELIRHKDVAAVSFTGSTEVGTLIY